jgi:hypothetical protein
MGRIKGPAQLRPDGRTNGGASAIESVLDQS